MTKTDKAPKCPLCKKGTLEIHENVVSEERYIPGYHYRDEELPTRPRIVNAAMCNGCEFVGVIGEDWSKLV